MARQVSRNWRALAAGYTRWPRSAALALLWAVMLAGFAAPAAAASPKLVYTYDARPLNHLDLNVASNAAEVWDTLHVLAVLQGLANRERPQLYLFYCSDFKVDTDQFWFDWFRGEDGWLKASEIRPLHNLEQAVATFRDRFHGLVVYDPAVPATSDVASTAAGCQDLLPVRFDPNPGSVYELLVRKLNLPVALWLVNPDGSSKFTGRGNIPDINQSSSGSAKVDAYRWAEERYLKPVRSAPGIAAYYVDCFWLRHPGGNPHRR